MQRRMITSADPLATAAVAFFIAVPCLAIVWGWLWLSFDIRVSFWWVVAAAGALSVAAWFYPGKWLEDVWVFCISLFFGTPAK